MKIKECPYCYGKIYYKAKKCRHCGEWVEKSDKIATVSGSNESEIHDSNHVTARTTKFVKVSFFADYLLFKKRKIKFDNIVSISQERSRINRHEAFDFSLYIDENNSKFPLENRSNLLVINFRYISQFQSKNKLSNLLSIAQTINKKTLTKRLNIYTSQLNTKGFIPYPKYYKIKKNSDVIKNGQVIRNLSKEFNNDNLNYGERFKGFRSSSSDPYALEVSNQNGLNLQYYGIKLYKNLTIRLIYDRAIMEHILFKIIIK